MIADKKRRSREGARDANQRHVQAAYPVYGIRFTCCMCQATGETWRTLKPDEIGFQALSYRGTCLIPSYSDVPKGWNYHMRVQQEGGNIWFCPDHADTYSTWQSADAKWAMARRAVGKGLWARIVPALALKQVAQWEAKNPRPIRPWFAK